MRFWRKRERHGVDPEAEAYIPLGQVGDDTIKAMTGQKIIVMDTPADDYDREMAAAASDSTNVHDRLMHLAYRYGPITVHFGRDGLWQAMAGDNGKVYSGQTKHQALDALERDLG